MVREFSLESASGKGVPDFRRFVTKLPRVDTTMLFGRSVTKMQNSVETLLDKVIPEEVPMPRAIDFGGLGRRVLQDSPVGEFLGRIGLGSASKARKPHATNTSGGRISGGPSLYQKGLGMYHKGAPGAPDTYAFENTPAGIKFAADHGYESIDLDMQITKDGVPVATHWAEPMKKDGFYDPLHKLSENSKVSELTLKEVMRLRNEDGQSRIYPMSTMIEHLKKNGIAGDLEAKDDRRFATNQVMGQLADLVRDAGIRANLKTIDYGSRSYEVLEMAQKHGFWVRTAKGRGRERRDFGYGS